MTIGELQARLQDCDPDAEVFCCTGPVVCPGVHVESVGSAVYLSGGEG